MKYLREHPVFFLLGLFFVFAPFYPQPHIVEKLRMLIAGTLQRPIDIFDLCWHGSPVALLLYMFVRDFRGKTPVSSPKKNREE